MIYSTIEPCKKNKGFEAIPEDFHNISLGELKSELLTKLKSYEILRETKIMLVLTDIKNGRKISIFPSCRVFIHGDIQMDEAKAIIHKIGKSVEKISVK